MRSPPPCTRTQTSSGDRCCKPTVIRPTSQVTLNVSYLTSCFHCRLLLFLKDCQHNYGQLQTTFKQMKKRCRVTHPESVSYYKTKTCRSKNEEEKLFDKTSLFLWHRQATTRFIVLIVTKSAKRINMCELMTSFTGRNTDDGNVKLLIQFHNNDAENSKE